MLRAMTFAIAMLCASPAHAAPCWVIRQAVAAYGEDTALSWARSHGYSEKQITEARKCLKR